MAKHLGRNPFKKKGSLPTTKTSKKEKKKSTRAAKTASTPLEWLMVELPAQSFLLGLAALLVVRSALGWDTSTR